MANKSEELRKVTTRLLKISCPRTYYGDAKDDTPPPYQTHIFDSQNRDQYPRDDDILLVDIWDKSDSWTTAERLADEVEANMNMKNEPNAFILPTFFLFDRRNLADQDKSLKHVQLKFLIQNYYIGA